MREKRVEGRRKERGGGGGGRKERQYLYFLADAGRAAFVFSIKVNFLPCLLPQAEISPKSSKMGQSDVGCEVRLPL